MQVVSGQGTSTLTLTNPVVADAGSYDVVSGTCTPAVTSSLVTVTVMRCSSDHNPTNSSNSDLSRNRNTNIDSKYYRNKLNLFMETEEQY
jgi:hypothetical protein